MNMVKWAVILVLVRRFDFLSFDMLHISYIIISMLASLLFISMFRCYIIQIGEPIVTSI